MKESILKQKTYAFALKVIKVYKQIVAEHKEYVLSKQFRHAERSRSKEQLLEAWFVRLNMHNQNLTLFQK